MKNEAILKQYFFELYRKIKNSEFVIDKSCVKTVELIDAQILNLNPSQPVLDFKIRKTNENYCRKELEWYLSQSLSIKNYVDNIQIWNMICSKDDEKLVNSNYGWCIFSSENYNQYNNCLNELRMNKDSRRAIMIYNRPSMWMDFNKNGMSDFICCLSNTFFIRNNKLISSVHFRSSDLIYGFLNDFYFKCYVYDLLYNDLKKIYPNLEIGYINWHSNSLHVYEKHFDLLTSIVDQYDYL
jgi:thymidylate synthase